MYPTVLTVSSDGPEGTVQSTISGIYKKEDSKEHNNRPVYQLDRGGQFLFYTEGGKWMIGPDSSRTTGNVCTVESGLPTPPINGWKCWNRDNGWREDPQLKLSGEPID